MNSFLAQKGAGHWVVSSNDDCMYGPARSPDPEGGMECTVCAVARVVSALPPAKTPDETFRVTLGPPSFREGTTSAPDALALGETYWLEIYCRMLVETEGRIVPMRHKTRVARVPMMVGSSLSRSPKNVYDSGYFVVNGKERGFVSRETKRYDYPHFHETDAGDFRVEVNSFNCPFAITYNPKRQTLRAALRFETEETIPIDVVLRSLSTTPVNFTHVKNERVRDALKTALEKSTADGDAEEALGRVFQKNRGGSSSKRSKLAARAVLDDTFMAFLKPDEKLPFLVKRLVELVEFSMGLRPPTDEYAMQNRCVETAGKFMSKHTSLAIRKMWEKTCGAMSRAKLRPHEVFDPQRYLDDSIVETSIISAMLAGTDIDDRATTVIPRKASWWEGIAVVRRVSAKIKSGSYTPKPRMFHGSWYGFYCACETQEGEKTGLNRETAMFFACSPPPYDLTAWRDALATAQLGDGSAQVMIGLSSVRDGVDPVIALAFCMERKRSFSPTTGVYMEDGDVHVSVSEGRALRPVWVLPTVVDDDADFDVCVREGRIVWIDANMAKGMCIATEKRGMTSKHTHLELHPTSLMGPSAANLPFADRNPGARNHFGAHVRQDAVGDSVPFARYPTPHTHDRFDTVETNKLWNRQRALCDTAPARAMESHLRPNGWNPVVFILAHSFGQEDSMCVSRRHIDLGAVTSMSEVSLEDVLLPGETYGNANAYPKIDFDGLPAVGTLISPNDVLVAKKNNKGRDASCVFWRRNFCARVLAVKRVGDKVCVRLGWTRFPEVGDKFATRHGQKGTLNRTICGNDQIGSIEDWWTADGVRPDFIINPHALPSRATIGNLFEMLCGKANALKPPTGFSERGCAGSITDCTPYAESFDYVAVQSLLRENGFQPKGHETIWSAKTGLPLDCQVFVGPAFMQRLTHFAFTKCYARGRGKRNPQTGQPPKGRKNEGGLKLGEMETKAMQAYGAAASLVTAHLECSDGIEVWYCKECTDVCGFSSVGQCVQCGGTERTVCKTTCSFMLMHDELKVAGIDIALKN